MKRNKTIEYHTWNSMKQRCLNSNHKNYPQYGGRGITICKEWTDSYEQFLKDMGHKVRGMTLDRVDNDGSYEPSNCRWATQKEQCNNKSNIDFWLSWVRL